MKLLFVVSFFLHPAKRFFLASFDEDVCLGCLFVSFENLLSHGYYSRCQIFLSYLDAFLHHLQILIGLLSSFLSLLANLFRVYLFSWSHLACYIQCSLSLRVFLFSYPEI